MIQISCTRSEQTCRLLIWIDVSTNSRGICFPQTGIWIWCVVDCNDHHLNFINKDTNTITNTDDNITTYIGGLTYRYIVCYIDHSCMVAQIRLIPHYAVLSNLSKPQKIKIVLDFWRNHSVEPLHWLQSLIYGWCDSPFRKQASIQDRRDDWKMMIDCHICASRP